jgi:hypothetical protein
VSAHQRCGRLSTGKASQSLRMATQSESDGLRPLIRSFAEMEFRDVGNLQGAPVVRKYSVRSENHNWPVTARSRVMRAIIAQL